MPKRAATPPPADDEPKHLTICYPYPPHANMELEGDRIVFARWIACCMGTSKDLYTIFHKPSAPNMIIIQVRRDYPGFRKLLGAHKWSEFVRSPGEHSDKVTRIYFSTFPTGRAAEKAGWKSIIVKDLWFKASEFSLNNQFIVYPYPTSSYCDLPSENQTGFTLCRPIPREGFEIRIPTPPPVPVGSADWVAQKELGKGKMKGSKKSHATSTTAALKGTTQSRASLLTTLQIPTPSMLTGVLRPGSSAEHTSHSGYGTMGFAEHHSSSPASNHSPSPVSRPQIGGNTGGSSSRDSISSIQGAKDRSGTGSVGPVKGNAYVAGGYFDAPNIEDEFGTSLRSTDNKDGTPICPSHGVVCKKGICRDYSNLLWKIEKEKKQASYKKERRNGGPETSNSGSSAMNRGRGRGNYRARGAAANRARGSPRGRAVPGSSKR